MSPIADHIRPMPRAWRIDRMALRHGALTDAPTIALVSLFAACVLVVQKGSLAAFVRHLPDGFLMFLATTVVSAAGAGMIRCFRDVRPASPIAHMAGEALAALRGGWLERWMPLALAMSVLMIAFSDAKGGIAATAGGFRWDATFHDLDVALHGGVAPWQWLQPILGYPVATILLDWNYALWFSLMWAMVYHHQSQRGGTAGRTRFMVSFVLLWTLGGSVLATIFSSAGPCFYGLVVEGPDPYQPLMASLHAADARFPLLALRLQDTLWTMRELEPGRFGISAMPSLHNAVACLMVLSAWTFRPWIRAAFAVHAVLVFLGSILLGWHYAIDAYLAISLTLAIWFGVGPIAARWDRFVERRAVAAGDAG